MVSLCPKALHCGSSLRKQQNFKEVSHFTEFYVKVMHKTSHDFMIQHKSLQQRMVSDTRFVWFRDLLLVYHWNLSSNDFSICLLCIYSEFLIGRYLFSLFLLSLVFKLKLGHWKNSYQITFVVTYSRLILVFH